jgi:Zn-dependent M28 family amino/carboxypeptidase
MAEPAAAGSRESATNAARQERLLAHLEMLARPRHARWDALGLLAVRAYISDRLGALGPVEEHRFRSGIDDGTNLILRLPGRQSELAPLLVAAHYDGPLNSPGADDNATGVAALLELAEHWSREAARRPVWLVAFDQEEWGMLGSAALAADLMAAGQRLKLMVSLEMLGYTAPEQRYPIAAMGAIYGTRGDFIAVVGNTATAPLLPGLARRMGRHVPTRVLPVPNKGRSLPDVRLSDHSPFWDLGYDALLITDTSFLRNPHYHRPSDTIDSLDLPFLAAVITAVAAGLDGL